MGLSLLTWWIVEKSDQVKCIDVCEKQTVEFSHDTVTTQVALRSEQALITD